jgi:hypothetical protein
MMRSPYRKEMLRNDEAEAPGETAIIVIIAVRGDSHENQRSLDARYGTCFCPFLFMSALGRILSSANRKYYPNWLDAFTALCAIVSLP